LRPYNRTWLRNDVLAGIMLAAYLIPAALGDASLANLSPETGLYACRFGGMSFWIFCGGSRHSFARFTHRLHCLASKNRSYGAFHLRERDDRLQGRGSAFSGQHTIAEALWFPQRSWNVLAERGFLLQAPG
jgi:hypothetical protein